MSMRTIGTFMLTSLVLAAATSAVACPNCKRGYVFGKPVAIGNGMAWTWVKLGTTPDKIDSMGVTFTETALEGLPDLADQPMPSMEYILELPAQVKGKPFDHVGLDWNPKGHPPMPLYGKAHFDIHFYTISQGKRQEITLKGANAKVAAAKPDSKFVPAGYINPPGTIVPNMGNHWINPNAKELKGQEFDTTFLYGSYEGKTAFWEPMITTKFLASKPNFTEALAQPQAYDFTGFYPTSYSVKYNESRREVTVSLDSLKFASAPKTNVVAKKKK